MTVDSWKNRGKITAFINTSKSNIEKSHASSTVFIKDQNAMKMGKFVKSPTN